MENAPKRYRFQNGTGFKTLPVPKRYRYQNDTGSKTVQIPKRYRFQNGTSFKTLPVPKRYRYQNGTGTKTVQVPKRYRYQNGTGTKTVPVKIEAHYLESPITIIVYCYHYSQKFLVPFFRTVFFKNKMVPFSVRNGTKKKLCIQLFWKKYPPSFLSLHRIRRGTFVSKITFNITL